MTDQMTPAELRETAKRLRGDILDAVPDDNDMQHVLELSAHSLDRLADEAEGRMRDAAHPEFVPEAVMDAAFESQTSWWRPGETPAITTVLVPQLIENVATAVYMATRKTDA